MAVTEVLPLSVRTHVADWSCTVWWLTMTGETAARVVGRAGTMTGETADTHAAIQCGSVTEATGVGDIAGDIVERGTRVRSPAGRMSVIGAVTALATGTADTVDPDIEARIAARAAGLGMAGLTDRQIGSGIGAVNSTVQVATIQRMGDLLGAVRVAAQPVNAG